MKIPLKQLTPQIEPILSPFSLNGGSTSINNGSLKSRLVNEQHYYQNSILLSYSKQKAHPVSLRHLANFGKKLTKEKLISSANFVRTELPIRLSLRLKDLQKFNFDIINNYHINQIYCNYYECFNNFRKFDKINTLEENDKFNEFLRDVLNNHLSVLPHLMMGALEISILQSMPQDKLDNFMSNMLRSRISRRVIIEQHISLSNSFKDQDLDVMEKPPDYVGAAFQYCSAKEHLIKCKDIVSSFVQSIYPDLLMPDLIIEGEDVKFQFLVNHLDYILSEILRNSLKSTLREFLKTNSNIQKEELKKIKPPPVIVKIIQSKQSIIFKIQDFGGGMPKEKLSKIWSFGKSPELAEGYLTNFHRMPGLDAGGNLNINEILPANQEQQQQQHTPTMLTNLGQMETINTSASSQRSILKSLVNRPFDFTMGISLPMCKVYTDYWNGELDMFSVEGYGTDVYLKLSRLGSSSDKLQLNRA